METIRVVVHGAAGKMGQEVVKALVSEVGMQLVGAVDIQAAGSAMPLPGGAGTVPFSSNLESILDSCRPDVLVDFTIARAAMPAVRVAAKRGVNLVIGTTGFSGAELDEIKQLATANKIGAVVAANFALGAVLMMHLSRLAARYFDYAEIIELHHHRKADAPSGTALSTARSMAAARGKPFLQPSSETPASRGLPVEGISVHSVRLPGLMAHQEVLLGTAGQTLSIRHDAISRECYMPGVMLAIREAAKRSGLIYGLDALLGL